MNQSKTQEIIERCRLYRKDGLPFHNDGAAAKGTPVEFAYEELVKAIQYLVGEDENLFWNYTNKDGSVEEHVDEERALARLLLDGILFCNERETVEYEWGAKDGKLFIDESKPTSKGESTTVLYVLCNDIFYWGTADAERLTNAEIGPLFKMYTDPANKGWGHIKWCCFKRKLRPQVPVVEDMKKDGVWDAAMEALPAPHPS